jgi:CheY-like chemotaxis protein
MQPKQNEKKVLVVDDNENACDALGLLLGLSGYEARCAYDGQAALRLAAEFRPHVAVLDIAMPHMTGFDVARALRAAPALCDMDLIALTAFDQSTYRAEAAALGYVAYLLKPTDLQALDRTLTRCFNDGQDAG